MPIDAARELVPLPTRGRRFTASRPVRLGDVDARGRGRLDAIARYLQDVAGDDVTDAGLGRHLAWVVRRTLIDVRWAPVLGERVTLTTFCSGTGRSWAERRTTIAGDRGGAVEAVSLWVQVDPATGGVRSLGADFHDHYGEAASGRRVSARLALPPPPPTADGVVDTSWPVRAVDLDVFDHVNNAAHWAIVEETLAGGRRVGVGELEHIGPLDATDSPAILRRGTNGACWLLAGDVVRTAARWTPEP